jgi:hypothetical protein
MHLALAVGRRLGLGEGRQACIRALDPFLIEFFVEALVHGNEPLAVNLIHRDAV